VQSGGPSYKVELGRFDGLVSRASDVNGRLPQPTFNLNQLNSLFAANGLTQTDMIALSGNDPATLFYNGPINIITLLGWLIMYVLNYVTVK